MNNVNVSALTFCCCLLIAGYCFGGLVGLGIAATVIGIIQVRP